MKPNTLYPFKINDYEMSYKIFLSNYISSDENFIANNM
jgi:hypothetical protein